MVPSLDCAWTFPSRIQVLRLLLADCTRKNSDNLGVLPGRRRYLGNGLMSGVLVATGYQGAFKGLRSPPINVACSPLVGQAQQWLCELLPLCCPKG